MGRNKRGIIFLTRCSSFSKIGWALARQNDGLKNRPTHKRGCLLKKLEHGVFLVFFAFICLATLNVYALDTDGDGITDEDETAQGYDPANYTHLIYVDDSRPNNRGDGLSPATAKKSIKAGILLVQNNGEEYVVLVAQGTYTGANNKNIELGYPEIKLRSIDGAETTIIDCKNSGCAFYIRGGQTEYSWIDGFTIRNGNKANGGAIAVADNSTPVIKNCVLESNYASASGGAFWIYNTGVTIENCVFRDNESAGRGGAILHSMGQFTIRNCLFHDNISGNSGGALYLYNCQDSIVEGGGTFTVNYSDAIDDYTGQGTANINIDPQLTSDGCLTPSSPCIDAGTMEDSPVIDLDADFRPHGSGIDMGCDEYNPDKDGDGMPDSWEMEHFGSLDQTAEGDFDDDGLNNLDEFNAGTNPANADSDNDGLKDGDEAANGLNPLDDSDPGSLALALSYPADNDMVR